MKYRLLRRIFMLNAKLSTQLILKHMIHTDYCNYSLSTSTWFVSFIWVQPCHQNVGHCLIVCYNVVSSNPNFRSSDDFTTMYIWLSSFIDSATGEGTQGPIPQSSSARVQLVDVGSWIIGCVNNEVTLNVFVMILMNHFCNA